MGLLLFLASPYLLLSKDILRKKMFVNLMASNWLGLLEWMSEIDVKVVVCDCYGVRAYFLIDLINSVFYFSDIELSLSGEENIEFLHDSV